MVYMPKKGGPLLLSVFKSWEIKKVGMSNELLRVKMCRNQS